MELVPELQTLQPGHLLGGHYQIESLLGAGGMGAVYKARHVMLKTDVAIKVLLNDSGLNLARFQREAIAVEKLRHPNIVYLREFGKAMTSAFLWSWISSMVKASRNFKKQKQISITDSLTILRQVCDAMAFAHAQSILHRDLKPGNVMVRRTESGDLHTTVVDFGIAKIMDPANEDKSFTRTGQLFGSALYMSPEQAQTRELDARSDIYSIGCIMYEMLTGITPIEGDSFVSTLMKQVSEKPLSMREVTMGQVFPVELEEIVMRALAKEPADRFQSAEELAAALDQFQKGKSEKTHTPKPLSTGPKLNNKLLAIVILLLICVLAAAFISIGKTFTQHGESPPAPAALKSERAQINDSSAILERAPASKSSEQSVSPPEYTEFDDAKRFRSLVKETTDSQPIMASGFTIGDEVLDCLRGRKNQKLDLSKTQVTDAGLADIATMSQLRELSLQETRVNGTNFGVLKKLLHLENLDISNLPSLAPHALRGLAGVAITELHADSDDLKNADLQDIANIRGLTKLSIKGNKKLDHSGMFYLRPLSKLELIEIRYENIGDNGAQTLSKLKHLQDVTIENDFMSDRVCGIYRDYRSSEA